MIVPAYGYAFFSRELLFDIFISSVSLVSGALTNSDSRNMLHVLPNHSNMANTDPKMMQAGTHMIDVNLDLKSDRELYQSAQKLFAVILSIGTFCGPPNLCAEIVRNLAAHEDSSEH